MIRVILIKHDHQIMTRKLRKYILKLCPKISPLKTRAKHLQYYLNKMHFLKYKIKYNQKTSYTQEQRIRYRATGITIIGFATIC